MSSARRSTALISGASSGIGAAASRALAARGYDLFLGGRDQHRLQGLRSELEAAYPGQRFLARPFDVRREGEIDGAVAEMIRGFGQIDLVVNSAGVGIMDFLDRLDPSEGIVRQIDTNLTGTILLSRAVLPSMIRRRAGTIILVGSLAGLVAMPTYSIYAATKFGLKGFADALRREVGIWGIRVVLFLPGTVDTNLAADSVARRRTGLRTPRRFVLRATHVGEAIADLAERPRPQLILPRKVVPAIWLARWWPRVVDWIVEKYFVRRERSEEIASGPAGRNSGKRS